MIQQRNPRDIYRELVNTPFFPLLFISEVVKVAATGGIYDRTFLPLFVLAIITTIMWIIVDDVKETVEDTAESLSET